MHTLSQVQSHSLQTGISMHGFLVSKETVVLRWWESETIIGFYQTL